MDREKKNEAKGVFIMKKKQIYGVLAAALIALTGAGCASRADGATSSSSQGESSSSVSDAISDAESDVESSVEDGVENMIPGDGTVSLVIKDEKLKAAYDAVKKEFAEYWLAMPGVITEQQMEEMYYIHPEDIEEFAGEMSLANISGDTLVLVKAKPGKAQTVADALEQRRKDIIDQFKQYPVNFMDVKSEAAKVVTEGDYVFLILMGDLNVPDGEDASLEMAQAEVERAEKAIRSVF